MRWGNPAFTLLELLIVVVIIMILATISVPVLMHVKEKSRRAACLNNLRSWGVGFQLFGADHDDCLPNDNGSTKGSKVAENWQNQLSSYVGIPQLLDGKELLKSSSAQKAHALRLSPSACTQRDMLNSGGSAPYAYGYVMNHNLDNDANGDDHNDGPFSMTERESDPDRLVLVFTSPHYTLIGDFVQTVLQQGSRKKWCVTHRPFRMLGGDDLDGAGFQAVFLSGRTAFVPISMVFTNKTGTPQWIDDNPQLHWFPESKLGQ